MGSAPISFNSNTGELAYNFETPEECAAYLWSLPVYEIETFDQMIELSADYPEYYDQLIKVLKSSELDDAQKLRVYPILLNGRPRKRKAETEARNRRFAYIAEALKNQYGLSKRKSASILHELHPMTSAEAIANLLS